jgi:ABC-type spermidine/putrescine transport system permease subunit I
LEKRKLNAIILLVAVWLSAVIPITILYGTVYENNNYINPYDHKEYSSYTRAMSLEIALLIFAVCLVVSIPIVYLGFRKQSN